MDDTSKPDEMQAPVDPGGYILPDGECLTADQLEARLKAEAASGKSPKESEEAKYKLATFYLVEAKPLLAYPILKAIRESTDDGERIAKCEKWLEVILGKRKRPPTERAKEDHATMLVRFGICFAYGDGPGTALAYFEKAVAFTENPKTKAYCFLEMGKLAERHREYENAARFYSKAFELEPEGNETWYFLNNNLGYSLNQIGRHAEAEGYCRRAIAIDPSRHNAHKNLGLSLRGQGRYREAVASFIEAVKNDPADTRAMGHLEEMLECRQELYREIFGIETGGLEQLRKVVYQATQQSWH
jgi:tetratricopeptide (TPR) repeat protein